MATQPVPILKTFWDGTRGESRWYCAWSGIETDNLVDAVIVDVSALAPVPNKVKIRTLDVILNGNFTATLEFAHVAYGVCNTATADTSINWVSGNTFDSNWLTWGNSLIDVYDAAASYTISSVDSAIKITVGSDPGDNTAYAFWVDEFIDRFIGQSDSTYQFARDYTDGPSCGLNPTSAGSADADAKDLIVTTAGVASGDELNILVTFERS